MAQNRPNGGADGVADLAGLEYVATWGESASATAMTNPTSSKQAAGWAHRESVPYQWVNWFFRLVGRWIRYLDDNTPRKFSTLHGAMTDADLEAGQLFYVSSYTSGTDYIGRKTGQGPSGFPSGITKCNAISSDGLYVAVAHDEGAGGEVVTLMERDNGSSGGVVWSDDGGTAATNSATTVCFANDTWLVAGGVQDTTYGWVAQTQIADPFAGWIRYVYATGELVTSVVSDGAQIYAATDKGRVTAFPIGVAMTPVWSVQFTGGSVADLQLATDGRYVYVGGSVDGSGNRIWALDCAGGSTYTSSGASTKIPLGLCASRAGVWTMHVSTTGDLLSRYGYSDTTTILTSVAPGAGLNGFAPASGTRSYRACIKSDGEVLVAILNDGDDTAPQLCIFDAASGVLQHRIPISDVFDAVNDLDFDGDRIFVAGSSGASPRWASYTLARADHLYMKADPSDATRAPWHKRYIPVL